MQRKYFINTSFLVALLLLLNACEEEEYAIPELKKELQNDAIKRSLGPNIVGEEIEFAYAMALPPEKGKLVSAQVEASIAGATGTYLDNKSYYTNGSGNDIGVTVGSSSVSDGNITRVTFTEDTSAATLRYHYIIPEAARGQTVNFNFSATSSNGEKVSYSMGPYTISRMDMKLDLNVKDAGAAYISIADMAVYTAAEAAAKPDKIDLIYLHRTSPSTFAHSLVAPAADVKYLPGINLPAGVNNNTKIIKAWNLRDRQLATGRASGIFIDDVDFQEVNFADAPNFGINLKAESGVWVETADGKYRAYVYVNSVNNSGKSAQISIKRYML